MHDSTGSVKLIGAGALASALGLTPDGVKVAETEGRLPPAERTPGGHRRWDPAKVAEHYDAKGMAVPERLARLAGRLVWTLADAAGVVHAMTDDGTNDFVICASAPARCCGAVLSGRAKIAVPNCSRWHGAVPVALERRASGAPETAGEGGA